MIFRIIHFFKNINNVDVNHLELILVPIFNYAAVLVVSIFLLITPKVLASSDLLEDLLNIPLYEKFCGTGISFNTFIKVIKEDVDQLYSEDKESCDFNDKSCVVERVAALLLKRFSFSLLIHYMDIKNSSYIWMTFIYHYIFKKQVDDQFGQGIFDESLIKSRQLFLDQKKIMLSNSNNVNDSLITKKHAGYVYHNAKKGSKAVLKLFNDFISSPRFNNPLEVCKSNPSSDENNHTNKNFQNQNNSSTDKLIQCALGSSEFSQYLERKRQDFKRSECFQKTQSSTSKNSTCTQEKTYIIGLPIEIPQCGRIKGRWTIKGSKVISSETKLIILPESDNRSITVKPEMLESLIQKIDHFILISK